MLKQLFPKKKIDWFLIQELIKRDLENLLNYKKTQLDVSEHLIELKKSVIFYGCDTNIFSSQDLLKNFDHAIRQFEPRITNYHIISVDRNNNDNEINLEGTAIINIQKTCKELQFEIIVNQTSKNVTVL